MPTDIPGGISYDGYTDKNAMNSGRLGYSSNDFPISAVLGVQYEADKVYNHHFAAGVALKYALEATDGIYLMYINSEFDSGLNQITGNDSELSSAPKGQQDNVVNLAINYYVMPSLNLIASVYFDYGQNVVNTGDDGERYSGLLVADYYHSEDFDAYIRAWYTQFADAFEQALSVGGNEFTNTSSVFSAIMGARFRF
jgi:hypothetical protein